MGPRFKYLVYIEYFWLLSLQVQFGSFGAFPIFTDLVHVVSQIRLIIEQNRPKFGPQRYLVDIEYSWLWSVQVQFGVIWCISNFADVVHVVSQKQLIVERKWPKFGSQGYLNVEYLWLLSVQIQFGVSRSISDFRQPCTCCISEMSNRRAKWTKSLASREHI